MHAYLERCALGVAQGGSGVGNSERVTLKSDRNAIEARLADRLSRFNKGLLRTELVPERDDGLSRVET